MTPFGIFRFLLHYYLKWKHGKRFNGLLNGPDVLWAFEDKSNGLVNGLMIINSADDGETFYNKMKQRIEETLFKYKKFKCLRQTYLGYYYLLEDSVDNEDILCKMMRVDGSEVLNEDQFRTLLTKYSNATLPKDNRATCEIVIGTQGVRWRTNTCDNHGTQYPVLYRLHHIIGDGVTIQGLILKKLVDKIPETTSQKLLEVKPKSKIYCKAKTIDKYFCHVKPNIIKWCRMCTDLLRIQCHHFALFKKEEKTPIHGAKLTGEKYFVWLVEDTSYHVQLIKDMKKKTRDVGFTEFLMTAIARSFYQYLKTVSKFSEFQVQLNRESFNNCFTLKFEVFWRYLKL